MSDDEQQGHRTAPMARLSRTPDEEEGYRRAEDLARRHLAHLCARFEWDLQRAALLPPLPRDNTCFEKAMEFEHDARMACRTLGISVPLRYVVLPMRRGRCSGVGAPAAAEIRKHLARLKNVRYMKRPAVWRILHPRYLEGDSTGVCADYLADMAKAGIAEFPVDEVRSMLAAWRRWCNKKGKRLTTEERDAAIIAAWKNTPRNAPRKQLQKQLEQRGINVSERTIRRAVEAYRRAGWSFT